MLTGNTVPFVSQVNALSNLVDVIGSYLDKMLVDPVKFRKDKLDLQCMVFTKVCIFLTIADYVDIMKTCRCSLEMTFTLLITRVDNYIGARAKLVAQWYLRNKLIAQEQTRSKSLLHRYNAVVKVSNFVDVKVQFNITQFDGIRV